MEPPFGFGKESGPNGPPKGYAPFGNSPPSHPYSSRLEHSPFNENRPASSITALQPQNQLQPQSKAISPLSEPVQSVNLIHPTNHQRPSPSVRYTIGHDAETKFPIKPSNFLVSHSNRSPSLPSQDNHFVQNYHSSTTNTKRSVTNMDMKHLNGTAETTKLVHPPPLPLQKYLQAQNLNVPPQGAERYDVPSITWDNQKKSPGRAVYPPHESMHSVKSHSNVHDGGTVSPIRPSYLTTFGRISSPPSGDASLFVPSARVDPERFDMSSSQRKSPVVGSGSPPQRSAPAELHSDSYGGGTTSPLKPAQFNGPKRARSPPLQSANVPLDAASAQINCEREMEAKAKRLARFNAELSRPLPRQENLKMQRSSDSNEAVAGKLFVNSPAEDVRASGEVALSDYEGLETSDPVTGLCPDMCPEPEREERERKGDLDKYERLNGERNQTSKYLAVKKYNRTAERDAELIRPMSVLQKTMDYLLNMLDQPYSDNFLGIYNFLWDRMRAIRMDLRMQHLFNQDAITMLEQMIRFHIAAMHELCEYKKGEGFSEGFDAHLNIEQMNKASVELFQMYDDHRKKGKDVPTEREFRGYYALLKLDRHPGYKVEPAELSLDLAKMSPEMRCSPEILFARDVARACRTGNYIAFFRLANKATYLQACLMHAHFGKIRTQALASLHSSLQNNQGIPVQNVVRWLGMEGEDIETLLEYQGFMLKKYEEIYMVKIGTFLNSDVDCPTKCSELVHQKKSQRIINDVYSGQPIMSLNEEKGGSLAMVNLVDQQAKSSMETLPSVLDEEMLDYKVEPNPVVVTQQLVKGSAPVNVNSENEDKIVETSYASTSPVLMDAFTGNALQPEEDLVDESDAFVPREETTLPILNGNQLQARPLGRSTISFLENSEPAIAFARGVDKEASIPTLDQKDKVSNGKLKEIIRKWKQHTLFQREIREQKLILADIALSSLSLGPPLHQIEAQPCHATGDLNIDHVRMERYRRQSKSWTQLNVSELVAAILSARNPDAQCICWKVVVYVQENDTNNITHNLASKWLLSKLLGTSTEDNPELVVTSPDFSIWKKWISNQTNSQQICCLSVVRKAIIGKVESCSEAITAGMCCAVFLVSEAIPWETQRNRLHDLLESIPSGSSLPLLVVNGDAQIGNITDSSLMVIKRLGLDDVDNTRINSSSVVFLGGNSAQEQLNYFFEDDQLREGLRWLADYSPLQPALRLVNIRELVLNYLRCSIEALKNLNPSEVGPEHCISALNAALDRAAEEILAAASSSPMHWPSPEIDLLEMSSNERIAAGMVLPSIGWNSARRIHSLIASLKDCRLPCFAAELSWLKQGAYMAQQIKNQKLALEDCLINYLVQSSRLLPGNLAAVEADVMLQKGTRIELQDPCYYVVPRWVVIFQRIYNWQLRKLALQELPDAYILDRCWESVPPVSGSNCGFQDTLESLSIEGDHVLHLLSSEPTFDEMFAVVCDTPLAQQPPMLGGSPQAMIQDPGQVSVIANGYGHHDDEEDFRRNESMSLVSPTEKRNQQEAAASAVKSPDKLTLLLRECHQLQDQIDEKLQIYF